jgi:hypothetical protein
MVVEPQSGSRMMRKITNNRIQCHFEAPIQDGPGAGKAEVIDPLRKAAQCGRNDTVEIIMGHDPSESAGRGLLLRFSHDNNTFRFILGSGQDNGSTDP